LTDGRETRVPLLPLMLGGQRPGVRSHPPRLGEHSAELLVSLGYSPEEISELTRG
jgi:crotonobetainyl-CoA:carnitine CoA-transferase CaiB-like acyl-CoA transferase